MRSTTMNTYIANLTTFATKDQLTKMVEDDLTAGEIMSDLGLPDTDSVHLLMREYGVYKLYTTMNSQRIKEAEKAEEALYSKPLLHPEDTKATLGSMGNTGKGGHAPRELVDDNLWAILDEIKSLMNEGHDVKQLLRKAGMEDSEITELMREVQFNSNVDIREMVRHGGYQPKIDVYRIPDEELKQAENKDND